MSLALVNSHEHRFAVGVSLADIPDVIAAIDIRAGEYGLDDDQRYAIQVCLEEVLANVILHGRTRGKHQKRINVAFSVEGGRALISVSDTCAPFDVTQPPPQVEKDAVGGRGLRLLQAFAKRLDYRRVGHRNVLDIEI